MAELFFGSFELLIHAGLVIGLYATGENKIENINVAHITDKREIYKFSSKKNLEFRHDKA